MNAKLAVLITASAGLVSAMPAMGQGACCYDARQNRRFIAPSGDCGPRWQAVPAPPNECQNPSGPLANPAFRGAKPVPGEVICTNPRTGKQYPWPGDRCP
jgi:hypothetical protein